MAYRAEPEGVIARRRGARARAAPRRRRSTSSRSGSRSRATSARWRASAEAAGADALVVAEARADAWNPNAIRASTGAVFTLPVVEASLDEVAGLGVELVAAVVGAPTRYTRRRPRPRPSRSSSAPRTHGLGARWLAAADRDGLDPGRARGSADSLNAATAAAILLFEAVRQRG